MQSDMAKPAPGSRAVTRALCEGAVLLALAVILNYLRLFRLPNGGSVDLAMLPVLFYAVRWGVRNGVLMGLVFGVILIFIDGAVAWGWQSLLLDYVLAMAPLGLAGLFRGRDWGIFAGTLVGALGRFCIHLVSGVTIYAILVPTELFSVTFTSPLLYSLVYNGSYMALNTALCLALFGLLHRPLRKYFMGRDIQM